ncbi:MAG: hypothetical protein AB8B69_03425 [Chitinophagales bacterium]
MMLISFAKNRIRVSLFSLAIALLMSSNMYATAPTPIGVSSHFKVLSEEGSQAIALYIPEANTSKVLIKIKNNENEILFEKRVKVENGYAKKFNLKGLEDGNYQMTVTDKEKVVKQAFQISGDEVWMSESEKISFMHPTVQYNQDQKLMKVVSFNQEPIGFNVYDTKGNVILSETGVESASKAYNLSRLDRGEYTVEVYYDEGEVYTETLRW